MVINIEIDKVVTAHSSYIRYKFSLNSKYLRKFFLLLFNHTNRICCEICTVIQKLENTFNETGFQFCKQIFHPISLIMIRIISFLGPISSRNHKESIGVTFVLNNTSRSTRDAGGFNQRLSGLARSYLSFK